MTRIEIPPGLLAGGRGEGWASWVDRLPRLLAELTEEWALTPDGPPTHGHCALVAPVRRGTGEEAALKVGFPHPEAEHEALALQRWGGDGAVRLLRADPHRWALLLERLHPTDLSDVWDVQACETVAGFYPRLHRPAPPQLNTLSAYAAGLADRLGALPRGTPLPPRLVEQAGGLAREFAADPDTDGTLIHTDLHYANVLAGEREEWLVIDPKPLSGDPHYELAPLLWNRYDELAGRIRDGIRDRFFAVVDTAGLDEQRARAWVVVRMLDLARQRLEDPSGTGPITPAGDLLTRCITVAKAVQD